MKAKILIKIKFFLYILLIFLVFLTSTYLGFGFAVRFYEDIISVREKVSKSIYNYVSKLEQDIGITVEDIRKLLLE